jgi:DnaJ-class molecular chaperone
MSDIVRRHDPSPAKKAPAKKAAAKKAPAKKAAAKKAPAKKAAAKKARANAGAGSVRALPAPPQDPYVVLGLSEPCTRADLRRCWRAYASRHHPDQGGDPATFARGRAAYEELIRRLS